jgi:hypothetical protein
VNIVWNPRKARVGDVVRLPYGYWRVTCAHMGTLGAVPLPWWQVPWAVICDLWQGGPT